jgi:hypothetical protein
MVLGALSCSLDQVRAVARRLREIKVRYGLKSWTELKWTRVSPSKLDCFRDVLDAFFDNDDLRFRAIIIHEKDQLRHDILGSDHDTWYYKMYFLLLSKMLAPTGQYDIYLDVKDTRSASKIRKLHEVLSNDMYDFDRKIVHRVQAIRSHEVEQLQLCDLLAGIVSYSNRSLLTSTAKSFLVERTKQRSGYSLVRSTLQEEKKFNLFHWYPRHDLTSR